MSEFTDFYSAVVAYAAMRAAAGCWLQALYRCAPPELSRSRSALQLLGPVQEVHCTGAVASHHNVRHRGACDVGAGRGSGK